MAQLILGSRSLAAWSGRTLVLGVTGSQPTAVASADRIVSIGGAVTEILYRLGGAPRIVVVEPEAAPALIDSIRAGRVIDTDGPVSSMGRLDCKTPSMIALAGLARDADLFVTITEAEAAAGVAALGRAGFATTPSGAAGVAALLTGAVGVDLATRVLAFLSEGPEDG